MYRWALASYQQLDTEKKKQMTVKIHHNPEHNGNRWANILYRLKALWMSNIDTVLFCGKIWRMK